LRVGLGVVLLAISHAPSSVLGGLRRVGECPDSVLPVQPLGPGAALELFTDLVRVVVSGVVGLPLLKHEHRALVSLGAKYLA